MKTRPFITLLALILVLALATPLLVGAQEEELECPAFPDRSNDVRTGYYMGEGAAFFASSQLARATNSFSCVIQQIDADYLPAYMSRAAVYTARRDYDKAVADYTRAIELDSSLVAAYNNRAIVYVAQQKYDEAMTDLNQVLKLDGEYVPGYSNRAVLYGIQYEFDLAIADLEQAIALSGIDSVVQTLSDPERAPEAPRPEFNRSDAQAYALLGIIYSGKALDNYRRYLLLLGSSGDGRVQSAAGSLESRFTFDMRLDDGTWLLIADFVPEG